MSSAVREAFDARNKTISESDGLASTVMVRHRQARPYEIDTHTETGKYGAFCSGDRLVAQME